MERPTKRAIFASILYFLFIFYLSASLSASASVWGLVFTTLLVIGLEIVAWVAFFILYFIASFISAFVLMLLGMEQTYKAVDESWAHGTGFFIPVLVFILIAVPVFIILKNPRAFPFLYWLIS